MDLTKILKPGMKVYSLTDGEVEIESVNSKHAFPIIAGNEHYTKEGTRYYNRGECILFPSKECRNWEDKKILFILNPPKEGDYLMGIFGAFIYNGVCNKDIKTYGAYAGINASNNLIVGNFPSWSSNVDRYATETEIDKLDKRLKSEGYRFDKESLKIVKLRPRAKKDETYFYIGSLFVIDSTSDCYDRIDDCRYENGNYFLTEEEAKSCLEKIKTICKK